MAVKKFNQRELKGTIDDTGILLSRFGCLICAICSGWSRLYPKGNLKPLEASKTWSFTRDGLLNWRRTNFDGMEFVDRIYNPPSDVECDYWIRSKDRFMVLELDHGAHWVMAYYYPFSLGWKWIITIDSWGGKIRRAGQVTGYATFERT